MTKIKEGIGKKLWCILLALALVVTMMPLTSMRAYAEETSDPITIDLSTATQDILLGEGHTYSTDGGKTYTNYIGKLTFTGTTNYSIIVNDTHDITLANVNMSNKNSNGNIKIREGKSLNVTLKGRNTLTQRGGNKNNSAPAINICLGATLTVTKESTGTLTAKGGYDWSAIDGEYWFTANIKGGTVNVSPYSNVGGGIGVGSYNTQPTTININNATVNATANDDYAAIGGRDDSDGSSHVDITITDSTVNATIQKNSNGAAIGAGGDSNTYNIKIEKSVVTAKAGYMAAAIGTSKKGTTGNIEIIDSIVNATAGWQAAAIGGGPYKNVGNILIQNSTVTAIGGEYAAGIGGGVQNKTNKENDKIILTGSNIYASGGIGKGKEEGADVSVKNKNGNAVALTKITLQGVSRDIKVTKVETASGYEEVDIMTIGGVLYLYLQEGESATKVIANGQAYVGPVTNEEGIFGFDHTCEVGKEGTPAACAKYAVCGLCKQDFGEMPSHDIVYSANENIITESCTKDCGHKETATLKLKNGANLGYTGSEIKPLEVAYSSAWQGAKDLSITYSDNTDVGPASGSITFNDKTATQTFEIKKGNMTGITATDYSDTYDGKPHSITVNVPEGARVSYSTSENGKYSTNNPTYTNVGTYTVYYKVEKDNYNTVTGSATVKIEKAAISVKAKDSSKVYGEKDPTFTYEITSGNIVGSEKLTDISFTRTDGEDVSTYALTPKQKEGANPNYDISFEQGTLTINKKTIGIAWENIILTYNGEVQKPTAKATGIVKGDEVLLDVTADEAVEIGTEYNARVTGMSGKDIKNYELPTDESVLSTKFSIKQKSSGSGAVAPSVPIVDEAVNDKNDDKTDAETPGNGQTETTAKAKELVGKIKLNARSSKTAKGNIKVTLKVNKEGTTAIKSLKDLGYTVKYKYYRSTKKASKYVGKITKTGKSFTNTKGTKGTKYYYKARVQVYDKDGKLVAQTALKQCKYASRQWSK